MAVAPHTARFVRPHVSDVSPQLNVLIIYSLTVRFDHTFSITSLGITFCLLQLSPKTQSWGSLSAFCTIPEIFTNWPNLPVSEHP